MAKDAMNAEEITKYMIGTPWKRDSTDASRGRDVHTEDGAFVGHFAGVEQAVVEHVIEAHNASLPSAAEPHDFVPTPGYESLCKVCDDDEGGDLHASRDFELYFVGDGSLAEILTNAQPYDSYASAREAVYTAFGLDMDDDQVDSLITRAPFRIQAFDMERMSDD